MSVAEMPFKVKRSIITLSTYKELQENGVNLPCPRCGADRMKPIAATNALSRRADVYICSICGLHEAAMDALGDPPLPYEQWALIASINSELPEHMRD